MRATKVTLLNFPIRVLISIDQLANVILSPILNPLLSKGSFPFGLPDETLSGTMGRNIEKGKCRACHWICTHILHPIDPNHCKKSIDHDEHAEDL